MCCEQQGSPQQEFEMTRILKSDLTYSLGGGFLMGALALFFMQPVEDRQNIGDNLAASVTTSTQIRG